MQNQITKNGLNYTLVGDYYLPNLTLPEEHRPIGKWGRLHQKYLEEHHPIRYNCLVLSGRLWTVLADLNEQARNRVECLVEHLRASEGVTEDLKEADPMAWVKAMNSIQNRAEEIVLCELIYKEDAR